MRVLHVNKRYPPHIGGIERHVQDLARAEAQRPEIDVEVVVVAEGTAGDEWDEGVRVHRVPGWGHARVQPSVARAPPVLGRVGTLRGPRRVALPLSVPERRALFALLIDALGSSTGGCVFVPQ